jgi:hypothetical protein
MKPTSQSTSGTSFHDSTITASLNQLKTICGEPQSYGDPNDKVQYDWDMETEDGTPFTIYDWKEYRRFGAHEMIEWHIGGFTGSDTRKAEDELQEALSLL